MNCAGVTVQNRSVQNMPPALAIIPDSTISIQSPDEDGYWTRVVVLFVFCIHPLHVILTCRTLTTLKTVVPIL